MQKQLIETIAGIIGHRLNDYNKPLPSQEELHKLIKKALKDFAKLVLVPKYVKPQ